MDVIKPDIIRVGNRYYRRNPLRPEHAAAAAGGGNNADESDHHAPYREEDELDWDIEAEADALGIEEVPHRRPLTYRLRVQVPSMFHCFLIGRKGHVRQQLELQTKTELRIPPNGKSGPVEITGRDRRGLVSAKTRIDSIVTSARMKCDITHFVCLPIRCPQLSEAVKEFRAGIAKRCLGDRGLHDSIFIDAEKLHLTTGVMVLADEVEVSRARAVLRDWLEARGEDMAFQVQIDGLDIMNDDPTQTNVLYMKFKPTSEVDRLQKFANDLVSHFVSQGIMREERSGSVKLHVTLINTRYREEAEPKEGQAAAAAPSDRRDRRGAPRESFDATNVMKYFGDFDFGYVTVDQVHLSQRHRTSEDGFYWSAYQHELPKPDQP